MKTIRVVYGLLFLLGATLLLLNLIGLFIPLRNPDIYDMPDSHGDDISLTASQLYDSFQQSAPSDEVYVSRVTKAVHEGILHYWEDDKITQYNLRIPLYENYTLFLLSYLYPDIYEKYEYCDYHKAIERGVGLCSQHAIILDGVLDDRGIASKIVLFPDLHVVVTAQVQSQPDLWWVLDPDYGVIIKEDLQAVLSEPEIVREYYAALGYDVEIQDKLIEIFDSGGEQVILSDTVETYGYVGTCSLERRLYTAKWMIPFFLMGVGMLPFVRESKG
jgi:hypothetical protein